MKKLFILISSFFILHSSLSAQSISFPTPELRVDTLKPLNGYGVTFMRPTTMVNKLTIKGNRVPPTFYFQIVDSLGYNRFGVTKNGMLVGGTHHDPQVNLDGLMLYGRSNALKGADAFVIGKGIGNYADTTMALGYHYDVDGLRTNAAIFGYRGQRFETDATDAKIIGNRLTFGNISNYADNSVAVGNAYTHVEAKPNTTAIGYGANRIEMDQQGGRFLGDWPGMTYIGATEPNLPTGQWGWWVNGTDYYIGLDYNNTQQFMKLGSGGSGGITVETDPTVPANVKAITSTNISNWNTAYGWGNHAAAGYLTSVPVATASTLGGVKAGANLNISGSGVLSIPTNLVIYLNQDTGDDSNNGLTPGAAVKTLSKAISLIPTTAHTTISISGNPVFNQALYVQFKKSVTINHTSNSGLTFSQVYLTDNNYFSSGQSITSNSNVLISNCSYVCLTDISATSTFSCYQSIVQTGDITIGDNAAYSYISYAVLLANKITGGNIADSNRGLVVIDKGKGFVSTSNNNTNGSIPNSYASAFTGYGYSRLQANSNGTLSMATIEASMGTYNIVNCFMTNGSGSSVTITLSKDSVLPTKVRGGGASFTIGSGRTVCFTVHKNSSALYVHVSDEYY